MKKKLILLFMTVLFCSSMTGCAGSRDNQNNNVRTEISDSQDTGNKTVDKATDQPDLPQSTGADNETHGQPENYENNVFYLKDGQKAELNEQIEMDGYIWTISSIEVTKERGNRQEADFNYWGEEMDADGTLTGGKSYLFVMVSCKNNGDAAQEVLLNSNGFVIIDEKGQLSESSTEARYISKKQEGNENPVKAFHYLLNPGEETGMVEIGYIIEDSIINDSADLYYCIGLQGSQLGNSKNRYIEVTK